MNSDAELRASALLTMGYVQAAQPAETVVFDGTTPNTDVTGTISGAVVAIIVPGPGGVFALAVAGLLLGAKRRRT